MRNNLQVQQVPVEQLTPNPYNTNVVSPANEEKIKESLKRFGQFKPILVREIENSFEIIGGEHRWRAAQELGLKEVSVINLGALSDEDAKKISLIDNGRYGEDDAFRLSELLSSLGDIDDLSTYMPYTDKGLESLFANSSIEIDDLEVDEEELAEEAPTEKPVRTHVVMRFKVPIEDSGKIQKIIERIMKEQGFTESDSLTNAGDALVYLCNGKEE
ncbi:ParB/RepB/Spo0J family partition protein [Parasutterella muris]|uniref:ParB/RepB/Spo0J family partition protein n=1 Tax=Parasutterella muris TaxID=2565572 RepID=UPI00203ABC9E|nr:ParB/RepB/Spo0J family partition protein [Parasutterella muris]